MIDIAIYRLPYTNTLQCLVCIFKMEMEFREVRISPVNLCIWKYRAELYAVVAVCLEILSPQNNP